jgi:RND family efflux transporter MFP subunit
MTLDNGPTPADGSSVASGSFIANRASTIGESAGRSRAREGAGWPRQSEGALRALLLLGPMALALGLVGCSGGATAEDVVSRSPEALPVSIAPVVREERAATIAATGVLAIRTEVPLSFKTGGVVERLAVEEGERVAEGQVLARLDLAEIEAQVGKAKAAEEQAQRDLERVRALLADRAATPEQLERAETALRVASADVAMGEFNLRWSELRAPSGGWVMARHVEEGELVSGGRPILTVAAADSGWVLRLGLADREVVRLGLGDPADVRVDALGGEALPGRVAQIAEVADPRTGTFEVEVALLAGSAAAGGLKSGFVARAELRPRGGDVRQTLVPIEALARADGREGLLYAVDPATAEWRPVAVRIAEILEHELAIESGLEGVDWVITDGARRVQRDQAIEIVGTEPLSS